MGRGGVEGEGTTFPMYARFRGSLLPIEQLCFDMGLMLVVWLLCGVTFYYTCDEGWSLLYSWFFAVNVGLGVGYGQHMLTLDSTKYFTCVFALVGTSLISGALALFYDLLGQRIKSQSISVDGDANHRKILGGLITLSTDYIKLYVLGACYFTMVVYGVLLGFYTQGYDHTADALLFAITNYTTAGLLTPKDTRASLWGTTLSLMFGIPMNIAFWGEATSSYFAVYQSVEEEDDDDDAQLAAQKRKLTHDDWGDFLEAELLKAGMVGRSTVEKLKRKFDAQSAI